MRNKDLLFKPDSTSSIGGNSDHIISFTLTCSTNHNIDNSGDVICQMYSADGDVYELLGGNRVNSSTDKTTPSITIAVTSATVLTVQCLYPAQRHTTSFIYLRGTGIPNTSIESTSLAHPSEDHRTDTVDSDILARIEVDVEYCNYEAQSGREYFMNIKQKQINTLSLRLTDAKNRPLGRVFGSSTNSTTTGITGSGTEQSTLGNLSFSSCVRRRGRVACVMRRLWSPLARSDTLEKLSKSLHVFHLGPPQLVVISMWTAESRGRSASDRAHGRRRAGSSCRPGPDACRRGAVTRCSAIFCAVLCS